MALLIQRPNGTEDVIPQNIHKWHTIEKVTREVAEKLVLKKSVFLHLKTQICFCAQ